MAFADRFGWDIHDRLRKTFSRKDADRIYFIALLRAAFSGIRDRELELHRLKSWASIVTPGVSLRKNAVSKLLSAIGANHGSMTVFMKERLEKAMGTGRGSS